MRQFIKEHPWRLEIVPGLMLIMLITVPLLYHHRTIQLLLSHDKLNFAHKWWSLYAEAVVVMLVATGFLLERYQRCCTLWQKLERSSI